MRAGVEHINLLQRSVQVPVVALSVSVLTLLALVGGGLYGVQLRDEARQAVAERETLAQKVKATQDRIAERTGATAAGAAAEKLRGEIEVLKPQAQLAQLLTEAVGGSGGAADFGRAFGAMAALNEPGLWLTALTVSSGGRRVEVQGEARDGSTVLRYARRANASLEPLELRLDNLEMQPPTLGTGNGAPTGLVAFKLF